MENWRFRHEFTQVLVTLARKKSTTCCRCGVLCVSTLMVADRHRSGAFEGPNERLGSTHLKARFTSLAILGENEVNYAK